MKYMLLIFTDPPPITDPAEGEKIIGEYMRSPNSIIESGEFVSGEALQSPDTATSVRVRGGSVSTTDGPFVETKEYLGGYYSSMSRTSTGPLRSLPRSPAPAAAPSRSAR